MVYLPFEIPSYFNFSFKHGTFWTHAGGRLRHAFLGIGFRERPQAYDFQAALHDHMKYISSHSNSFYFLTSLVVFPFVALSI